MKLALWPKASIAHHTGLPVGSASSVEFTLGHNVGSKEEVDAVIEVVPKNWTGGLVITSLTEKGPQHVEEKTEFQRGVQGEGRLGGAEGPGNHQPDREPIRRASGTGFAVEGAVAQESAQEFFHREKGGGDRGRLEGT